jgi:hypothetical protein
MFYALVMLLKVMVMALLAEAGIVLRGLREEEEEEVEGREEWKLKLLMVLM